MAPTPPRGEIRRADPGLGKMPGTDSGSPDDPFIRGIDAPGDEVGIGHWLARQITAGAGDARKSCSVLPKGHSFAYSLDEAIAGLLGCAPHRPLEGVGIRRPVALHYHAAQPQQARAIVAAVIDAVLEARAQVAPPAP